jgi:hypothetical protein
LHFVIVDDSSTSIVKIPQELDLNLTLLRVMEDIPWNNPGARNLGMMNAKSDKCFLTDIDHILPEKTLYHMVNRPECGRNMYRIHLKHPSGSSTPKHSNTFLLSRARFMRHFGYDEDFCGNYGFDDTTFVKYQKYNGTRFLTLSPSYYGYIRTWGEDKRKYHTLVRDLSVNEEKAAHKLEAMKTYGRNAGHSRKSISFPWEIVEERVRKTKPGLQGNTIWQKTWYLRWILGSK